MDCGCMFQNGYYALGAPQKSYQPQAVKSSQVKWFISETPVGVHERTSMKEHLVRHGSKHKIQEHTTKRNKQQQKQKQNRTYFQNKNNEKPEKDH